MEDREREKPAPTPDANADDEEYELEESTAISAQEQHAKEVVKAALDSIDIDEIYREAERERGGEIVQQWIQNFRFRFQLKHLFIGTAVLAIALTLSKLELLWPTLIISLMLSIFGLYVYLQWQERKHQAEVARKRYELYARRRDKLRSKTAIVPGEEEGPPGELPPAAHSLPISAIDEIWQEAAARERFRFRFSLRELIMAMTTAAVIFGMTRIFGGPASTATVLGFVALSGLVVHALGFEPPQMVILGWWFILVLYVLLSIFAAVWANAAT